MAADSTASEAVDESVTHNEDLTEEAPVLASEIEKVVQDLDKDADGSFQVQPQGMIIQNVRIE